MNKAELVSVIAQKSGLKKSESESALNAFMAAVQESITANEKVTLVSFGTFEQRARKARTGLNPRTKKPIAIPATQVPVFKAGKGFKDSVTGKSQTKKAAVKKKK